MEEWGRAKGDDGTSYTVCRNGNGVPHYAAGTCSTEMTAKSDLGLTYG